MAKEKSKARKKTSNIPQESGVDDFIKKLRKKGIDEGKYRANEIIKEAELEAEKIKAKAEEEANAFINKANKDAIKLEAAVKESIKTSFRDSVIELQNSLQKSFIKELKKIVKKEVSDKRMIKKMILQIVDNSTNKDKKEILIADSIKDGDKIKSSVYGITKEMLKDGLELKNFASPDKSGILIKESKKGLEIDLTDKAIADLMLDQMLPVYRELLIEEK